MSAIDETVTPEEKRAARRLCGAGRKHSTAARTLNLVEFTAEQRKLIPESELPYRLAWAGNVRLILKLRHRNY